MTQKRDPLKAEQQTHETDFPKLVTLDDEIAFLTDWHPLKSGGSNFGTHRLREISNHRVELESSRTGVLFASVFIFVGFVALTIGIIAVFVADSRAFPLIPGLMGLIFAGVGSYLLIDYLRPIVFDTQQNLFWKGFSSNPVPDNKSCCSLSKVHAIQLIDEKLSGSNNHYYSYELNLVLKSGERVHVVDHGNRHQIQSDAEALGKLLNVPIWDKTSKTDQKPSSASFHFSAKR